MKVPKVIQPTLLFPKVRPTDKGPRWGQGKGLSLITMAKHWARYLTCILFPNSHSHPMDSPISGAETDSEKSSDLPQVTQKVSGRIRTDIQVYKTDLTPLQAGFGAAFLCLERRPQMRP